MRKTLKTMILTTMLVLAMGATCFANPSDDLSKALLSAGVPSSYVGTVSEYLQKTKISESQYNTAKSKLDQAKAIIGNTKDLSSLSSDQKSEVMSLAREGGNALGLTVKFGKDNQGRTTLVATDANGGTVLKMSTADGAANFDLGSVVAALQEMVEFSNSSNKGEFTPVGGTMTKTATEYGNTMLAGVMLIAFAGGIFVVSKRRTA